MTTANSIAFRYTCEQKDKMTQALATSGLDLHKQSRLDLTLGSRLDHSSLRMFQNKLDLRM